ncbi:hypothetical protein [Helicovermis profundi]|uniref:Uncharacterized protein n=1 Tax=Helicovermis profundi TaxID=3065157 RepID=A0AAU9E5J7_9FIRM|nr:hypothetical protein HLPR_09340 [Clostridia bacterium S502]
MYEKKLYSSLNILYLKMFQYEKYIDCKKSDEIFEYLNKEIKNINIKYGEKFNLSKIPFKLMLKYCVFNPKFDHNKATGTLNNELENDLKNIELLKKRYSKLSA